MIFISSKDESFPGNILYFFRLNSQILHFPPFIIIFPPEFTKYTLIPYKLILLPDIVLNTFV